jgi:hypothetical protein
VNGEVEQSDVEAGLYAPADKGTLPMKMAQVGISDLGEKRRMPYVGRS